MADKDFAVGLVQLKLASDQVQAKHAKNGQVEITPAFIAGLAEAYRTVGLPECTPDAAYQIWHEVAARFIALKKNIVSVRNSLLATESTPTS